MDSAMNELQYYYNICAFFHRDGKMLKTILVI